MPNDFNVYQQREIERMDEYQQPNAHPVPLRLRQFAFGLFAMVLGLIVLAMCAVAVRGDPDEHALCRAYTNTQVSLAGRLAEWDTSIEAWKDMPADLGAIPIDFLPIPDNSDWGYSTGYELLFSVSKQELWIIPYWSLAFRDGGTHDFCPAVIYDLNPEHLR